MSIMSIILTFTVIWIVVIFIVLPIGIKMPKNFEKGHADSAPEKHYVGLKLIITFCISLVLTAVYWLIVG
ncbi:MAG: DUF1467 family protein [Pseudomonadota bacterium]